MDVDALILGVLSWYPASGYQMRLEMERGGAGLYSALTYGSIYPRLKALEQAGLIVTRDADTGGRRKQVHELTADGWLALAEALRERAAYPIPTRDDLLLKMSFWELGRPDDRAGIIPHLRQRADEARHWLRVIEEWPRNGMSYISEFGGLIFDYWRGRLTAELEWIERAVAQLEGPPRGPMQDPNDLEPNALARRSAALGEDPSDSPLPPSATEGTPATDAARGTKHLTDMTDSTETEA